MPFKRSSSHTDFTFSCTEGSDPRYKSVIRVDNRCSNLLDFIIIVNLKQSRATNSCVHFSLRNLANGGIHLPLLPSIRSLKYRKCVVSSGCVNSPGMTVYGANGRPSLLIPEVSRLPVAYGTGGSPSSSRCVQQRSPFGPGDSCGCLGKQSNESILLIIWGRSLRRLILSTLVNQIG